MESWYYFSQINLLTLVQNVPIFDFPFEQIVPCFLHLQMAVTRLLLKLIGEETQGNPALTKELRERFDKLKLKLPLHSKKDEEIKLSFEQQLEKARFQRP